MPARKIDPTDPIRVVIAGNYPEYNHWCYVHHVNPRSRDLVYVTSAQTLQEKLQGNERPIEPVYVGTYRERRDLDTILFELEQLIRIQKGSRGE